MLDQNLPNQQAKRETKGVKTSNESGQAQFEFQLLPIITSSRRRSIKLRENDDLFKENKKRFQNESSRSIGVDNQLKGNSGRILGQNCKRRDFQLGEYDYTAETVISDVYFYDDSTPEEYLSAQNRVHKIVQPTSGGMIKVSVVNCIIKSAGLGLYLRPPKQNGRINKQYLSAVHEIYKQLPIIQKKIDSQCRSHQKI